MKILSIVGKVDTRVLAYPLARALTLSGQTVVVTEDGAYRRLYFGDEDSGSVSGVDVIVVHKVDETFEEKIKQMGLNYDNVITISSNFIPENANGVIVCKAIDETMMAPVEKEEAEEVKKAMEDGENEGEKTEEAEEKKPAEPEIKKDEFKVPKDAVKEECYISYENIGKKGDLTLVIKDNLLRYVHACEERKELVVLEAKEGNKAIAQIASKPLGMGEAELETILNRKEYDNSGRVR